MTIIIRFFVLLTCLAARQATAEAPVMVILGDSLSAAYGIPIEQGWVALLEQRLRERGKHYRIVNASISGETTHGGLARLPKLLEQHRPNVVVVELGANDGLQGLPVQAMEENLKKIIVAAKSVKAKVLLVPMRLPPNLGPYVRRFESTYLELAEQERISLSTFILDGIADKPELVQDDHLHPRADAQPRMLENLWPGLEPLL